MLIERAVWVAVRIPDGYISAHANQARIQQFPLENLKTSISSKNLNLINNPDVEVIYSHDVIDYARSKGLFSGSDTEFSFSDVYNPITFDGARFCDARVWAFFNHVCDGMDAYWDYARGENLKNRNAPLHETKP